ncbi:hypothetical protein Acor_32230 [Acrocarpospora corrugata]|uniref:DUF4239 domain-containing protein n=1 Tax=Acrocarpospora corrugata TaxID=35763 RepID=A0A5M3VYH8_9ACTN|nr:DUF4239 domain-containing protein [Acrocarpospora corrugata]GES01159.1 hypothetical protein Acor_32230 [Acrocarpospora corrugata]
MGWIVVFTVGTVVLAGVVLTSLRRRGHEDADGGAGPIDFAVNIALAVFLVVVAYAVVLCRDAISASEADVSAEAESLTELYWAAAPLPGSAEVRTLVRAYTTQSIDLDWPLMAKLELSPVARKTLDELRAAVVKLNPANEGENNLRTEALARASEVSHARSVRADDASTELEPVFFISMVISGLLVIVLPWTLRQRPTVPSMIADLVRIATVVIGIVFIQMISHPYGVEDAIDPSALQSAQTQYNQIDKQFPLTSPASAQQPQPPQ